jgi:hypothetical protein
MNDPYRAPLPHEILDIRRIAHPSRATAAMGAPERWQRAIERSPFEITATYDGGQDGRPSVAQGATGLMLWHELTRL